MNESLNNLMHKHNFIQNFFRQIHVFSFIFNFFLVYSFTTFISPLGNFFILGAVTTSVT